MIAGDLNDLAKDLDVPVMVLSQINKDGDAKESGDIFNRADIIINLERASEDSEAVLEGRKGRDVGTWRDYLTFSRFVMTWRDV